MSPLTNQYHIPDIPREYGLLGRSLPHSKSPEIFKEIFKQANLKKATYSLFELQDISELPQFLATHPDLKGFNVTNPYKRAIIPYLNSISDSAGEIGAVNVVSVMKDPVSGDTLLSGHNTDWWGFHESIVDWIQDYMEFAVICGTGGAARAVAYSFLQKDIEPILLSRDKNRIPGKDRKMLGKHLTIIDYSEAEPYIEDAHIIVNATPLGTFPDTDSCPPLPWHSLDSNNFCYDLVYNPPVTAFMKKALGIGAAAKNGLQMLRNQADYAWMIWRGMPIG